MEKKELNIWKNKVDIEIPEIEEDNRPSGMIVGKDEDPTAAPFILNQKVNSLAELERICNTFNVTSQNPEIDLGPLTEMLIPYYDTQEMDEQWEFRTLKNEISTIVLPVLTQDHQHLR